MQLEKRILKLSKYVFRQVQNLRLHDLILLWMHDRTN